MKTTTTSSSSQRRIASSQGNRDKCSDYLSSSPNKIVRKSDKGQQITDLSSKTYNTINHPYFERLAHKNNLTINNQSQNKNKTINSSKNRNKSKELYDIRRIKAYNQKDFLTSINRDCSFKQIESPESKVGLFEKMIVSIKEQALNKYQNDINHKKNLKDGLEKSIEEYKKKINQYKIDKKAKINASIGTKKKIDVLKSVMQYY